MAESYLKITQPNVANVVSSVQKLENFSNMTN